MAFSQYSYGVENFDTYRNKVIETNNIEIDGHRSLLNSNKQSIERVKNEIAKNEELLKEKIVLEEQKTLYISQINKYARNKRDEISKLSAIRKKLNQNKLKYLNCISEHISKHQIKYLHSCYLDVGFFYLDSTDKEYLKKIEYISNLNTDNIYKEIQETEEKISRDEEYLKELKSKTQWYANNLQYYETKKRFALKTLDNMEEISKSSLYHSCHANMPTIDLENKYISQTDNKLGVFYNIPQENQGALGTCYANTAKNLLLGVSKGAHNANYLDLAIQYKDSTDELSKEDLEGGFVCHVLKVAKERGYCKQRTNEFDRKKHAKIVSTLGILFDLKKQVRELSTFQNSNFLKVSDQKIIAAIQGSDILDYPLSILTAQLFLRYQNDDIYNNSPSLKKKFASVEKYNEYLTKKEQQFKYTFLQNIHNQDKSFMNYSDYLVHQLKIIFDSFNMEIPNTYLKRAKTRFASFNSQDFITKTKKSIDFLLSVSATSDLSSYDQISLLSEYLGNISRLSKQLELINFDINLLFNKDGNIKHQKESLQLVTAPECLENASRTDIQQDFFCSEDLSFKRDIEQIFYNEETKKENIYELRILASLLRGIPLGNTHRQGYGSHINTIVGIRFNKQKNQCELKLRDSQNDQSTWKNAKQVLESSYAISEIIELEELTIL